MRQESDLARIWLDLSTEQGLPKADSGFPNGLVLVLSMMGAWPAQAKQEIDAILYEAGLEKPGAQEQKLQQWTASLNKSSGPGPGASAYKDPAEAMEW